MLKERTPTNTAIWNGVGHRSTAGYKELSKPQHTEHRPLKLDSKPEWHAQHTEDGRLESEHLAYGRPLRAHRGQVEVLSLLASISSTHQGNEDSNASQFRPRNEENLGMI